ncbi:MAG: tyrosine-type recombinase/integrase [Armatimonadota bacterium]
MRTVYSHESEKTAKKGSKTTPRLQLVDATGATGVTSTTDLPPQSLQDMADALAQNLVASSTRRAYTHDWSHFVRWCADQKREPLPATADTVRLYLTDHAQTYRPATLGRRLVAICRAHKAAGLEPPTRAESVRNQLRAIRRTQGTAQSRKTALTIEKLREMIATLPSETTRGKRDRALLLLGFAGAFRRSELVGLDVADVSMEPQGLLVTLRRSKTDQEGAGRTVGIPTGINEATCPVRAYQAWIAVIKAAGIRCGPVFRSIDRHGNVSTRRLTGESAATVVKKAVSALGLDSDPYAGHSLRAGLVTEAARQGIPDHKIMAQTGHKSRKMLDRYIRDARVFENNAAAGTGL